MREANRAHSTAAPQRREFLRAGRTRVDERHVGIVYEGSQAHLVFEKIPLAELLKLE